MTQRKLFITLFHPTRVTLAIAAGALACAGVQPARAAEPAAATGPSVSVSVGTLGLSLGVLNLQGPADLSARVLLHSGSLAAAKHDDTQLEGVHYDVRQRFGPGVSVLGDYRPWHDTGWRLTGGLVISRLNSTLSGRPDGAGNYEFNGRTYNVAQVGLLQGRVRHKPVSLYLGGGWESKPQHGAGWRFVSDLGVLLAAKPSVTLTGSNAAGNVQLQQDLAAEAHQLRKPGIGLVGSVGAAYAF